jgi:4-amino-4-deoxy-L-arabinose transferase-like glycosyltransferase
LTGAPVDAPAEGGLAPERSRSDRPLAAGLALGAICAFLYLYGLGRIPLSSPNEGLYAEVAREMLAGGDWVLPHADGVVYFEKPPLAYWLTAFSLRAFGENAFAARLPSALSGLATALLLYFASRRLLDRGAAPVAAATFATSVGYLVLARQVMFDSLLTLWTTLALVGFWIGTSAGERLRARRAWLLAAYAGAGLAVLTKGLVGIVLPGLVVVAYALVARDLRRLREAWSPGGVALFLMIAVPWHVAAALRHPRFIWFYFVNEHWLRFLGRRSPPDFHEDPIYAPALAALVLVFPWTFLVPAALRDFVHREADGDRAGLGTFLAPWLLGPVFLFTVSRTRTYYYLLPVVPALALAFARLWARWRGAERARMRSPWTLVPAGLMGLAALAAWGWATAGRTGGSRGAGLRAVESAAGGWFVAGLAIAIAGILGRTRSPVFLAPALATVAALPTALSALSGGQADLLRSGEHAAALVRRFALPGVVIAMEGKYENHSALAFALPLSMFPVLAVEGHRGGDLQFGGALPGAPRVFATTAELFEIASSRPVFYLTLTPSKLSVPNSLHVVLKDEWATLWSNCVPPAVPAPPTNSPYVLWNNGGWEPPAGTALEARAGYVASIDSGSGTDRPSSAFWRSTALATAWPRKWLFRIAYAPPPVRPPSPRAAAFSSPSRIRVAQGSSSFSE